MLRDDNEFDAGIDCPVCRRSFSSYARFDDHLQEHEGPGKPAHDARLVAAMQVHGLTAILTFDSIGFSRYDGIDVVHPAAV